MRFYTTHNGEVIAIEFDEYETEDGQVFECEVFFEGTPVTKLLIDRYEEFLWECGQHLKDYIKREDAEAELDRGVDLYIETRRAA